MIFRLRLSFWLAAPLVLLSAGCGSSSRAQAVHASASPADAIPRSRDADDLARFAAGLPGNPGSPFLKLQDTDAWREHRRSLDQSWDRAESTLLAGLHQFQQHELTAGPLRTSTVFYPFGGPDALTATLCFPDSPSYVLVGLEPPGTLLTPAQLDKKDLPKYLRELRETVASELYRSFFITRQMDRQLRGQITDGVVLPVLHLLVRTHHTILGFRRVRIDEQGRVINWPVGQPAPARPYNYGAEIEFRTDADGSLHTLSYFSVNLSDKYLADNNAFRVYAAANLQRTTTLLKATSYMTHRPEFSSIRNIVLSSSSAVLQDDSGIPYHFFPGDAWKRQLYGEYERPYGSFRWLEQPDLRKAYQSDRPKPLTVRIGYGYSRIPSNLLLATRAGASSQP